MGSYLDLGNPKRKPLSRGKKIFIGIGLLLLGFVTYEAVVLLSAMAANRTLKHLNPGTSAFIDAYVARTGKSVHIKWVPLANISDNLKRAVIVAEDDTFLEHEGLNYEELEKSWEANVKKKKAARGGSTITMQLVKNLYLSSSKNPLRKLNEVVLALDIERALSKQRILEIYLNVVEWGDGIYGIGAASRYYYEKDPANLSTEQAAFLAAILPNPVYLTTKNVKRGEWRKRMILRRLNWAQLPKDF